MLLSVEMGWIWFAQVRQMGINEALMRYTRYFSTMIHWLQGAFFLGLIGLTVASPQPGASPLAPLPDFAAVDRYIKDQIHEQRIPGLALGIVKGQQIVYLQGFGVAGPDGRAMTPQTPLSIGSLTKSFTAVAIMQQVKAGMVDLDAPVQRYLPWFQVADPVASAQITIRQLLTHSSGLPRTLDVDQENRTDEHADTLKQRLLSLAQTPLEHAPGTYSYSNTGYQVLAMVLQQVTGQSYETYIAEHIFAPLSMDQSFTTLNEANQHGLATGYHYWFGYPVAGDLPDYRVGPGNGGLFSSAEDMSNYLIAQLNGGTFGSTSILSPDEVAVLHTPAVAKTPEPGFYAMGWAVDTLDGVALLTHSGQSYNYLAKTILVPDEQWGVVVLQNAQYTARFLTGDINQDRIADGVLAILRGQPIEPPHSRSGFYLLYAGFILLIGAQLLGLGRTGIVIRRWLRDPQRRPQGWMSKLGRFGTPIALNLAWALITLIVLPQLVGDEVFFQTPDLSTTVLVSGGLALISATLRLAGIIRSRRRATAASAEAN